MQCVILAGGRGSRLGGMFGNTPKHLVPVNGRPFADYQLARLIENGFTRFTYCLGFGSEKIIKYISQLDFPGVTFDYVVDGANLVGTGGALRRALDANLLDEIFAVSYGDTLLSFELQQLRNAMSFDSDMVLAVLRNNDLYGLSNTLVRDGKVILYSKVSITGVEFSYIDYGISIIKRDVISKMVPIDQNYDLSEIVKYLASISRISAHEVSERFFEVGSPEAIRETEEHLRNSAQKC